MKNLLILLVVLLQTNMSKAQAQQQTADQSANYFTIGPRVGVNFTDFKGVDAESKTGANAGILFVYSFQEHFGVSSGIFYSMEGAKYTTTTSSNGIVIESKNKFNLSYIRVPVLASVFFGQYGDKVRPKISLGPCIGFLVGAENKSETTTTEGSVTSTSTATTKVKDNFTSTDFGAVVAAGLNIRLMERTWLNFDVDYYMGAVDIRDVQPSGTDALKNNGFSVNLGVGFGL